MDEGKDRGGEEEDERYDGDEEEGEEEEEEEEGDEEEEEAEGEPGEAAATSQGLVLSSVNLYDKDILKGFRIRRFVDELLTKIIGWITLVIGIVRGLLSRSVGCLCWGVGAVWLPDDAVQEAEGDDEVDMAMREATKAMQESMLEMGIIGELPLTFGSAKARQEMAAVAAATASRRTQRTEHVSLFPVGTLCDCLFPDDGLYYPAKVEAHLPNGKVCVTYEGYDDTRPVKAQWLRPLATEADGKGASKDPQQQCDGAGGSNKHIRFIDEDEDNDDEAGKDDNKEDPCSPHDPSEPPAGGSFGSELLKLKQAFLSASSGRCGGGAGGGGGGGRVVGVPAGDGSGSKSSKKRRRNSMFPADGKDEPPPPDVPLKYWMQRFRYFSQFDRGTRLDAEGWFSATPERIAEHIAERCRCDLVVDLFTGCGGNAIQFAMTCNRVIAIDIDPHKLACARHNARIYGVEDRIEFILGDAIKVLPHLHADVIFMSPPWGGPEYMNQEVYSLETIRCPVSGVDLLNMALDVSPNVVYFLPKNVDVDQVASLARGQPCEIEDNLLNYKLKTKTAYFGGDFLPTLGARRKKRKVKRVKKQ